MTEEAVFTDFSHPTLCAALAQPELLLLPQQMLLPDGMRRGWAVWVRSGAFERVGPAAELCADLPHLTPLHLPHHLLMPGLIDAHTHLSQALGKALAFGEPSEIFRRIWVPMETTLRPQAAYLSAKLAALEALRGGFTTVVDAGTRMDAGLDMLVQAVREAGIRCVLALTCNDLNHPAGDAAAFEQQSAAAVRHLARFEGDALITPSLGISIPEVASDRMLAHVAALTLEAGVCFQTHANEHLVAVERSLVARGLRPVELLAKVNALNHSTLLAHATLLTPRELGLIRDAGAAVAYNPVASAWKGNAVLNAELLHEQGIPLALGTDGTRYDAFRLMDAAETAQRLTHGLAMGDFSCGGGWMWLDHGTHLGAQAIGLGTRTGAIAPGLAADFLLVDLEVPEMAPSWDLGWELVRLADRSQIDAVYVNGRLRLLQGWPTDWDGRSLMAEVRAIADEDITRAPIQRIHPVSEVHRRQRRR
jgi:5-methylthioadenosine/S-adenosylhomocysteine deaminase